MATTAFFNSTTGNVWVAEGKPGDANITYLPKAANRSAALVVIARRGYVRTGNWLPAYGPVVSVTLRG